MLKVAICDDDISELSNIVSILKEYQEIHMLRYDLEYYTFHNALDLISALEKGHQYDIIFLDILMPMMSGIEAAKEIRSHDQMSKIIFLTSSPEFAVDSYEVDAFYYALKPIISKKLFDVLDKALSAIQDQDTARILIKSKTGLTRIPLHTLEYVEVSGRTIFYHLINGTILEEISQLTKLEQVLLSFPQFSKPHRSYIVNLDCIEVLTPREIKLYSDGKIPIAKKNYTKFKDQYMARAFYRADKKTYSSDKI